MRLAEISTESYQNPNATQSKQGGYDRLNAKRETVADGLVKPLVVEENAE